MARYNHYFAAFSGGELSPQMLGRSDTDVYRTSAQTIDNFIVAIQGGVSRRPGFKYIADAKVGTTTRLIPFYHSSGAEYVLEFSDLVFRIFKEGAVIGGPTEITTPYTSAQLGDLDFSQSGDTMYITHESHLPQSLTRSSDTSWTLADVDFKCAPMYPIDDDVYGRTEFLGNTGIAVSSLSANILDGSATLVMSGSLFAAGDVGKFMRIKTFTADAVSEANADIVSTTTSVDVKIQDGVTLDEQISGSTPGTSVSLTGTTVQSGTDYGIGKLVSTTSVPGYAYDSSFHLSIPDLFVKLPATTTSTRTTGYSTVQTTVARTYTGTSGTSAGVTGNSSTSVAAVTNSLTGTTSQSGSYAVAREVATSAAPGHTIANTWGSITTQYTGSSIASENVTVTGNVAEEWGLVKITGYTDATTVTVTIKRPLSSTTFHTSQQWQMSRFGANTGYPKHVTFHEGRCVFANLGDGNTNVMVGSKTNSIVDFENGEGKEGTLTAATAFDFTLAESEAIQWLNPSQRLLIGSRNGVFALSGGATGINPLTAPVFRKITSARCASIRPIFMQGTTFFVHEGAKKLGGVIFRSGEFSGFDFEDMTKLSDHLTLNGIKEIAVSGDVLWSIDTVGNMRGLTYNEETKLVAWHKHDVSDTYESLQNVGSDIYVAVTRAGGQYIETMNSEITNLVKEDIICVDSSLTYDSTPATIITGLDHLEGETVDILADGAAHRQLVVSGNQITLDAAASVVQVGLPYTSTLKTNEVVGGNRRGSSESRVTRIHEVGVKFLSTNGAIITAGDSRVLDVTFNDLQVYGSGPDLFTGTKLETLNSGNTLNPTVTVTSSGALPISILGISADTNVSET